MGNIDEYNTFKDLGKYYPSPVGYEMIRVHLVHDFKYYGHHKAMLAADLHITDIPVVSVYYGVVLLCGIWLLEFIADINKMETWATGIGNA